MPESLTPRVITGLTFKPKGVLVNANNKGYCRVIFDADSINFFTKNVSMIKDDVNRSNIWRILCDNMRLNIISGQDLLKCVITHLESEEEEFTLPIVL